MGRHPDPVRLDGCPEAGTPDVSAAVPVPVARGPGGVRVGLGRNGATLEAARWRAGRSLATADGWLGCLLEVRRWSPASRRRGPTGSPLDIVPVARDPLHPRRRLAPDAADPEIIAARGVPGPVAGDPLDILARRLLVRRHLLDRVRRLLGLGRDRLGVVDHGRRKGLVDRPLGQHLAPRRVRLGPLAGVLAGRGGARLDGRRGRRRGILRPRGPVPRKQPKCQRDGEN